MPNDPFLDEGSRVVTLEAFDIILRDELKRAVRAQNFLTLLNLETSAVARHDRSSVVRQVAALVVSELRETDVVAEGDSGRVWVLLLDTDARGAEVSADRLLARLRHYGFGSPVRFAIGAASCPADGTDVQTLKRATDPARPARPREGSGAS